MNLKNYLRIKIVQYFNPLAIKDKCEYCQSAEKLEVHHEYLFIDMVNDTLKELNLELKEIEEYTEIELLNITEKILGKHLYYNYKTLCNSCHIEVTIQQKLKKEVVREVNENLPTNLLNKWLIKTNIEEYIKECNYVDLRCKELSVNKFLKEIENFGFVCFKKRIRVEGKQITHYKITKLVR